MLVAFRENDTCFDRSEMKKQILRIILAETEVSFITTCLNVQAIELLKEIRKEYKGVKISIINIFEEVEVDLIPYYLLLGGYKEKDTELFCKRINVWFEENADVVLA